MSMLREARAFSKLVICQLNFLFVPTLSTYCRCAFKLALRRKVPGRALVVTFGVILLGGVVSAGPIDTSVIQGRIKDLEKRAKGFHEIESTQKEKKLWEKDRLEHINEKRKNDLLYDRARKKYISAKKKQIESGDRGFAADEAARKKARQEHERTARDYRKLLVQLKKGQKKYRKQVSDFKELGLPSRPSH